jgi:hypothetical protein
MRPGAHLPFVHQLQRALVKPLERWRSYSPLRRSAIIFPRRRVAFPVVALSVVERNTPQSLARIAPARAYFTAS